jgi:hypothetical protein
MNDAIKLALEKGEYEPQIEDKLHFYFMPTGDSGEVDNHDFYGAEDCIDTRAFLLDPLFWQALGKALGWNMKILVKVFSPTTTLPESSVVIPEWHYHGREYFDLLLTGGDTEKF